MAATAAHPHAGSPGHFDEFDPHGSGHHEHVIVPPVTLRVILGILLFFTLFTVGVAQAEVWAMGYFNIELPGWINVVGAMTIAVIKALLVMAFFMQLKYDNPMNSLIIAVSLVCVALFIFFSGLDLFTRKKVYEFKSTAVVSGGAGQGGLVNNVHKQSVPGSMVTAAREHYLKEWGEEKFARIEKETLAAHAHGGHDAHYQSTSTASVSRPRAGLTHAAGGSAVGHGEHAGHGTPAQHEPKSDEKKPAEGATKH